jgi:hypothetical protein
MFDNAEVHDQRQMIRRRADELASRHLDAEHVDRFRRSSGFTALPLITLLLRRGLETNPGGRYVTVSVNHCGMFILACLRKSGGTIAYQSMQQHQGF